MARMHSGAKGKSGSKRPVKKIPSWAPYKDKEVEKLIVKLAKAGHNSSEIGLMMRDSYGLNSVKALTGKTIGQILEENKITKKLPEDLLALIKHMIAIKQHLEKNKQDETATRGLELANSKIRRISKYYQRIGKLPVGWTLDTDRLKIYIE